MAELTHLDSEGRARMVDVSDKAASRRAARAEGRVFMAPETLARIEANELDKGDALSVARLAGIMGAKRTAELIPLCHPLALSHIDVALIPEPAGAAQARAALRIEAGARLTGQTGVEMEALTAVSVAALAIYDMCKAVDAGMEIGAIRLLSKTGGRSDRPAGAAG